jgi:DNA repair protein RadC
MTAPTAEYAVGHRIRDLHEDECPRERLLKFGPGTLSNAELIAVLLCITY